MTVEFVAGDLFKTTCLDGLAHGCNCAGAMGRGIAVEFSCRWPAMFAEYRRRCLAGRFHPGDVFVWQEPAMTIFNLATQASWTQPATLEAIEASVAKMLELAEERGVKRIGLPRIGAGLGGLRWGRVRDCLERLGRSSPAEMVVFETYRQS